jgi:hypothetical protein
VIRDKIEHEPESPPCELLPRLGQPVRPAERCIHHIPADAVGGTHNIAICEIRKSSPAIGHQGRIGSRDRQAGRAAFPDTHEPDGIDAKARNRIPFLLRHVFECDGTPGFPAQFTEPYPRVDFIDARMWRPTHRRPVFQLFWPS